MADCEYAMMDTEYLLWLLEWDCQMKEGKGLGADDVELICRIITARKKVRSEAAQDQKTQGI